MDAGAGGEKISRSRSAAGLYGWCRKAAALAFSSSCCAAHFFASHDFRCGDGLPDVTLRMVGDMDQQAAERRRQILFANGPAVLEMARAERKDAAYMRVESCVEFGE